MHIDLVTLSLLGALQALLLAPLLLVATRAYAGVARTSLRIWGVVLLLQALGWAMAAFRGHTSDWVTVVLANGLLIVSYAETTRALRLLLGVPQRRTLLLLVGLAAWLAIVWFAMIAPDYGMRVYVVALALGSYLLLLVWPLRHALRPHGSIAQRVMLAVLLGAVAVWTLRLRALATGNAAHLHLMDPSATNVINMIYSAIEPVFASIGFLLMYNETVQTDLRRVARRDPLTGTLNRMAVDEAAARLFRQPPEPGCAVLMIDVDHFKSINDRFGHAGGDQVLATLATSIGQHVRAGDILGRVGGEEFVVLLPHTGLADAVAVAESLRTAIASLQLVLDGEPQTITISIGVAVREAADLQPGVLIRRADRALYAAKHAGRNRVMAAPGSASTAAPEAH